MNYYNVLKLIYPHINLDPFNPEVIIQDDGEGFYIKEWNSKLARPEEKVLQQAERDWDVLNKNQLIIEQNKQMLADSDYKMVRSYENPKLYPMDKELLTLSTMREAGRQAIRDAQKVVDEINIKYGIK